MRNRVEAGGRYYLSKNEAEELKHTKNIFIVVVLATVLSSVLLVGNGFLEYQRIAPLVFGFFWLGTMAESILAPGLTQNERLRRCALDSASALAGAFGFMIMWGVTDKGGYTENYATIRQEVELRNDDS